jgi:hypothetical protein
MDLRPTETCLVLWFIAIGCVLGRACVLADMWPPGGATTDVDLPGGHPYNVRPQQFHARSQRGGTLPLWVFVRSATERIFGKTGITAP